MELEKGKISYLQFVFMIVGLVGTQLFMGIVVAFTRQSSWLAVVIATLASLLMVWLFIALCKHYPGKTLIEFNDLAFGPYLGKAVSVLYIIFIFHLLASQTRDYAEFYRILLMAKTPLSVFLIMGLGLAALAVRKGLETIGRLAV
ncbi:MAG: spore germination protein, partial [Peptococcaceae bacterium]|nr:spore germination protein [Peptococcaceae bacterium]